ncbi:uncharacterized protein LOC131687566 [Topomyia yanbarensis]|uniref:uncharacterized protein LOC131687566 n=1 Tax=Topomyia yanbarensis TaxID=2498891 RepID=UPI00273ABB71|nr:uncharacterized protein LOC131687566 [Topomyia yanbarensis]
MVDILRKVRHQHASANTVYHCLYDYYYLGVRKDILSKIYSKHRTTISNWIRKYEEHAFFSRKERAIVYLRFKPEQRRWLVNLYESCPIIYLDEAKSEYERKFYQTISTSSISRILHAEGMSWKVLERRAIQLRMMDIYRFVSDMAIVSWDIHCLLFLDEVSFDNRGMLRNKGYAPVGDKLIYRGEFVRRPLCSMLSFLGYDGVLETYSTEGTFTREKFFKIFEKYLKRVYVENNRYNLTAVIAAALQHFKYYDCSKIFAKCGYLHGGQFDPSRGLCQDMKQFGFKV